MARFIDELKRTHHAGALRASDAGKEVVLFGWVTDADQRKLGSRKKRVGRYQQQDDEHPQRHECNHGYVILTFQRDSFPETDALAAVLQLRNTTRGSGLPAPCWRYNHSVIGPRAHANVIAFLLRGCRSNTLTAWNGSEFLRVSQGWCSWLWMLAALYFSRNYSGVDRVTRSGSRVSISQFSRRQL